jgi:prepilin-type N-terminal cleavage/methylation domain-containing protein
MDSRRNRGAAGFTLVELVAVLLLLAVLAAVVVTRAGNSMNRVPGTAESLVQNLAYARSRAMSTTNTWTLAYGVAGVSLARDGAAVPLPDPDTATVPAGVTISGGDGSVTFDAFGAPDGQKAISVTDGTSTMTVTVWAETGMIE